MAWNRPTEPARPVVKKKPYAKCAAFAVTAVALLAGVYFVFFVGDSTPEISGHKGNRKGRVADKVRVSRADLAKIVEERTGKTVETEVKKDPNDLGWYTNKMGEVKRRTAKGGFTVKLGGADLLFTNDAENQLDAVVNTPVGQGFFDSDVPEDFEDEFAYSLTNKIVITADDTPEDAERKQRVIEAKEILVRAKKEGRDLRELMLEAKRDLVKKSEDFLFFENGLRELQSSGATADEVAEYALAAKKMMQDKGIEQDLALPYDEKAAYEKLEKLINPKKEGKEDDVQEE